MAATQVMRWTLRSQMGPYEFMLVSETRGISYPTVTFSWKDWPKEAFAKALKRHWAGRRVKPLKT